MFLFVIVAAALQWILWTSVGPSRFILFYPTIIFTSLFWGLYAGLAATLFGALAAVYLFFPPVFNLYVEESGGWVPILIFMTSGISISIINELLQRRNRALAGAEARQKADERFRQIFESSPNALLEITGRSGIIIMANSQTEKVFGYPLNELIGQKIELLVPDHFRAGHSGLRNGYAEHPTPKRLGIGRDLHARRKDGSEVPVEIALTPIEIDSGQVILATITDISERKRVEEDLRTSEKRLNKAQEISHVGSWELNLLNSRLSWSDEVYRIFGLEPQEFGASYEAFLEAVHPDDRKAVNAAYQDSLQEGKNGYEIEHRVIKKSTGEIRIVDEKCEHFRDNSGRIIRSVGMVHDITERKQLEISLRAAVLTREEFLSIASHELKTPLATLYLQLQLLIRLLNTEKPDMNRIASNGVEAFLSCQNISQLLDTLLDITRIRAGKLELHKQDMDLCAVVVETISRMSEEAKQKGSIITFKANQSVMGVWDPTRINQIISNLLSNAIKYGDGKPIEITITADQEAGRTRLHIQDWGLGIPNEMQSKIFDRFERAVTDARIGGLGLGLYIVRQLVEAHGGSIHVESEPGKGSLFTVSLPFRKEEQSILVGNH